jgi:hypothetical protein
MLCLIAVWRLKVTDRLAPRARFELATLRLTAEVDKNLSAASGVAYGEFGAIFPFLVAPNPAPKLPSSNRLQRNA